MKKLSAFWYVFKRSLTDPDYYNQLLKTSFTFSLKYLFALLFFTLLIRGLVLSLSMLSLLPQVPKYVGEAKSIVRNFYPSDLVITINNGTLRTNVDEPYTIPFPKQMNISDMSFAVIDTKGSVEDYKKYKTVLYVTKNAVAYPDSNSDSNGYKVYPFSNIKKYLIINHEVYLRLADKVIPYFNYAPQALTVLALVILILLPSLGSVFYLLSMLFSLLLLTLLTYVMSRLVKKPLDYQTLYRMGMHGVTFSILFDLLKTFFGLSIPLTFIMPFLIWMLIVLNSLKIPYGTNATPQRAT